MPYSENRFKISHSDCKISHSDCCCNVSSKYAAASGMLVRIFPIAYWNAPGAAFIPGYYYILNVYKPLCMLTVKIEFAVSSTANCIYASLKSSIVKYLRLLRHFRVSSGRVSG